jgi:hypothetical protein
MKNGDIWLVDLSDARPVRSINFLPGEFFVL